MISGRDSAFHRALGRARMVPERDRRRKSDGRAPLTTKDNSSQNPDVSASDGEGEKRREARLLDLFVAAPSPPASKTRVCVKGLTNGRRGFKTDAGKTNVLDVDLVEGGIVDCSSGVAMRELATKIVGEGYVGSFET